MSRGMLAAQLLVKAAESFKQAATAVQANEGNEGPVPPLAQVIAIALGKPFDLFGLQAVPHAWTA